MEQLPAEEKQTENGEGSEKDGTEFERDHRIAEKPEGKRLKIDEESFSSEIRGIEEFETVCLECVESIDAIGCFIRIETDGNGVELIDAEKKSEEKKCDERESEREM